METSLKWKKYSVLNAGHIALVDWMGNDNRIAEAARTSFGNDVQDITDSEWEEAKTPAMVAAYPTESLVERIHLMRMEVSKKDDRRLIRYMMNHTHTTPFEMCEICFHVKVPMDCWRQWIRHRTANVNEYSTRYTEAIDECQTTPPEMWRLQSTDNKQGSSGFLTEWPEGWVIHESEELPNTYFRANPYLGLSVDLDYKDQPPGDVLSNSELITQAMLKDKYELRLRLGIAKEQARKDLPLSNYTQAYWKCDLHNIFNFLRLRMDSHAQYEIRMYANAMAEIVKQLFPVAYEAFEDYVLYAKKFSRMEMELLKTNFDFSNADWNKPDSMTNREWKEFLAKLS